jgi:hypothetical protein
MAGCLMVVYGTEFSVRYMHEPVGAGQSKIFGDGALQKGDDGCGDEARGWANERGVELVVIVVVVVRGAPTRENWPN